jgi:TetR/AcrR family transcriptional repressor of bet genes
VPRVKIQDIRRQEFIEATIQSIHEFGFVDLTVAQIAKVAGLSAGNVHYYFGSKNELLAATMQWLLVRLRQVTIQNLAAADSARARVEAIIDSNFAAELFTPAVITAWMQFWAQAPHYPQLKRLQRINAARVRSNLNHALKQLLSEDEAVQAAAAIQALIDGQWIQAVNGSGTPDLEANRQLAHYVFRRLVPAVAHAGD